MATAAAECVRRVDSRARACAEKRPRLTAQRSKAVRELRSRRHRRREPGGAPRALRRIRQARDRHVRGWSRGWSWAWGLTLAALAALSKYQSGARAPFLIRGDGLQERLR